MVMKNFWIEDFCLIHYGGLIFHLMCFPKEIITYEEAIVKLKNKATYIGFNS